MVREAVDEFVVLDAPLFAAMQKSQDENGTPRH